MSFSKVMLKIHLYLGLAAGVFLLLLSITGCLLVYVDELDRLFNPGLLTVKPQSQTLSLQAIVDLAQKANPNRRAIRIQVPPQEELSHVVLLQDGNRVYVNGHTGEILGTRHLQQGLPYYLNQLHTGLLIKNRPLGKQIVGYASLAFLVLAITGLILWWPRKLYLIKRSASWRRFNFEMHNASGFYSFLLTFVMALTGIAITFDSVIYPLVYRWTGEPPKLEIPKIAARKGVPFISADQSLIAAKAALPGAKVTWVGLGFQNSVDLKFPEDGTPAGRSHVFLDPYTGNPLLVISSRAVHAATMMRNFTRPLHTGDIYGSASRFIWFIACFTITLQAITGVLIWLRPKRKNGTAVSSRVQQAKPESAEWKSGQP